MKITSAHDTMLPADIEEQLLEAIPPVSPAPERRMQMRKRVLRRIHQQAAAPGTITIDLDDGRWTPLSSDVQLKHLQNHEDGRASYLMRMAPGSKLPAHPHDTHAEECLVLQGTLCIGELRVGAGGWHVAPQGVDHDVVTAPEGALIYLRCAPIHAGMTP